MGKLRKFFWNGKSELSLEIEEFIRSKRKGHMKKQSSE